jgi:hypothetical protein
MYIVHGVDSEQSQWKLSYDSANGKLVLTITPNDGTAAVVAEFTKDA